MTDFIDSLLTSMSSKFNEANTDLAPINLNEDKTLKWRGLHNNQYAAVKKRKDGKRNEKSPQTTTTTTTTATQSANDPPPLLNNADDVNATAADVTIATTTTTTPLLNDGDTNTVIESCIILNEKIENELNDSQILGADTKHINADKMERTNNNDKERPNDIKDDDQRPFRRTLRRKQNTADDSIDELNVTNRKIGLRSTRQSSASGGSVNENRSVSPKRDKDDTATNLNRNSVMTRQRGRAKKIDNELNSSGAVAAADDVNDSMPKTRNERNNSIVNDVDDGSANNQPTPPKLRRSERMHSSVSSDHNVDDRTITTEQQKFNEMPTRSRKRTVDDKKTHESPTNDTIKEEKSTDDKTVPSIMDVDNVTSEIEKKIDDELDVKKSEEIEISESTANDTNVDDQLARKRGRKPTAKAKTNLKLNTTISTRNSPVKKSPRFSSDESPFCYTIPKKDKAIDQPVQPQQRLSRRIKPTPKILANEELRQGFEIQNNARLSLSSEHLDNELDRSPKSKSPPQTPQEPIKHDADTVHNGIEKVRPRRKSNTPPKRQSSSSNGSRTPEFIRPQRQPCPDPEQFLNEIKLAKINLHRSPEDNKKLNFKQKKRLIKLKEKHFQKLGLQRVSRSVNKGSGSDSNAESDSEDFVPTQKVNVGQPSVTLRVRGQKDIVIYNKHITKGRTSRDKLMKKSLPPPMPSTLIDQLDRRSKELISRNPEISLISSTKHKTTMDGSRAIAHKSSSAFEHQHQITSEVTLSIRKEPDSNICFCNKISKFYTRKTDETYCSAVDQIENQKVGCSNDVDGELLNLLRPSVRASYMLLCESHRKRLYSHNCCPGCGVFLTQGCFVLCAKNHFFHRDCATKFILNTPFDPQNPEFTCPTLVLKCPHCGIDAPDADTIVQMRCSSVPIFTTSQKKLTKPAKMSVGTHSYRTIKSREETNLLEIERLVPESIINTLARAQNRFPFSRGNQFTNKDVFHAITKDDTERLAEIIASGFDITTPIKEFYNGTCLHLVSNFGSIKMANMILSRVTSIDFFNILDQNLRTAIMCAIHGNKHDILKLLVQCGADITIKGTEGMTALHLAVKNKNYEAVELLLNTYRESATLYQLERYLNARDDGGWTAIVWAADVGNSKLVSALLNCGADPSICDAENNTALHWATLGQSWETVQILLQARCNINTQNINGDTALHIACRLGNTRIALHLLQHGASLNITNNANELPRDCITEESGACRRAIFFNLQMRNIAGLPEQNIICQDISNGRETYPIQIVGRKKYRNSRSTSTHSDSENDQIIPDFKYITKTILLQNSIQIDRRVSQMRICSCLDNCTSQNCQCSEISIQNWYSTDGRLISDFKYHDPAMIFECNDVCGWNKLLCKNRVVQNGSKVALQIFECAEGVKGYGVRGIAAIPRGTFIAEYTGEILTDSEADRRTDDGYFFDLGSSGYCIDANFYGNVSRFFNHSCEPNTVPIRVYHEHQDLRFPKIAFFATRNIEAGEEITFDYGEKFWIAKHKLFTCHCGAKTCRFSERNIAKTLEEYNQRANS